MWNEFKAGVKKFFAADTDKSKQEPSSSGDFNEEATKEEVNIEQQVKSIESEAKKQQRIAEQKQPQKDNLEANWRDKLADFYEQNKRGEGNEVFASRYVVDGILKKMKDLDIRDRPAIFQEEIDKLEEQYIDEQEKFQAFRQALPEQFQGQVSEDIEKVVYFFESLEPSGGQAITDEWKELGVNLAHAKSFVLNIDEALYQTKDAIEQLKKEHEYTIQYLEKRDKIEEKYGENNQNEAKSA